MDLNQVTLEVRDFHEGVAFFEALGLRLIVSARGEYARFELPSGSSTLSIHVAPAPRPSGTVIYFEVENVDRSYETLRARGIAFETEPADQGWRWREARLSDPTGNRFCLFHAGNERRFPPWRLEESAPP